MTHLYHSLSLWHPHRWPNQNLNSQVDLLNNDLLLHLIHYSHYNLHLVNIRNRTTIDQISHSSNNFLFFELFLYLVHHFNSFPNSFRPPFCWPHHALFFHQHLYFSSHPFMSIHISELFIIIIVSQGCNPPVPSSLAISIKTSNLHKPKNLFHQPFQCLHPSSWNWWRKMIQLDMLFSI